ncbi:hypothetical protein WDD9_006622 [Paenibacillus melissococcoides]|uniref:hypothetical protein n=1 Tax=Paenibacillus melissococcoides TaxID=2912268 RepID=UPI0021C42E99|nr:hypothetical protein [Paenibacillus melissococcoides]CAH8722077.1 hypothetical protein HTL2_006683 [Paenibacillus melissococcoides]CAH8722105.1 hypothetical protein WDD9_006622 [Paenibacillus melissococcoides]
MPADHFGHAAGSHYSSLAAAYCSASSATVDQLLFIPNKPGLKVTRSLLENRHFRTSGHFSPSAFFNYHLLIIAESGES